MSHAVPEGARQSDDASRSGSAAQRFWRTLAEHADEAALEEQIAREFPQLLPLAREAPNRRQFLAVMGASLALAGLAGCDRRPSEKIVPYVFQPEQIIPGRPLYYATASLLDGFARGVLAESHMGRPTKVEGNPQHPASLGASDVFMQSECLTLYDPDRTQTVFEAGDISTWDHLLTALRPVLQRIEAAGGAGLRLLTGNVTSPTLVQQFAQLRELFPESRWHSWQPLGADNERAGARLAWGDEAAVTYRFDRADVIVSLDADFFAPGPAGVRYAMDFMNARRRPADNRGPLRMNRLYVIESTLSLAGAFADHRLPLGPAAVAQCALALARRLGVDLGGQAAADDAALPTAWLDAVAADLTDNRPPGTTLIIAGSEQPPAIHALVHAMNERLGNIGQTVVLIPPVVAGDASQQQSLRELVADMQAGNVELLVIFDTNPVYAAPADLEFASALDEVGLSVHLSFYFDETSAACDWHVPSAHALESWADARAYDGTVTILQPLIAPLYNSKSSYELVSLLAGHPERAALDIVREYWQAQWGEEFERRWAVSLHDGLVEGSAATPLEATLQTGWTESLASLSSEDKDGLAVVFRPDPTVWDGSYANNGWLQELPKPISKLTWDNAALFGPATAQRLGLANQDVITLTKDQHQLDVPVWVLPGIPENTATVYLGGGRTVGGSVAQGRGFNAYRLRTTASPGWASGVQVAKTGHAYPLVCTQEHHLLNGRDLLRAGTLAEWQADPEHPEFMRHLHDPHDEQSLFPTYEYPGYKWAMSIDTGACIACNACVVACQAENNIPVVGKDQVANGREMHWIRIDTYFTGGTDHPRSYHQPLPCMHCEHAPCELVCPVAATVHSSEGLNQMVYNRCVGTRYCSNNCPYKVRRFNFLQYNDWETPVLELLRNPDVTVRSLGVMEKCTYCTQRISAARINAEKENRTIQDGEVVTACQQACPTNAIIFGDLNQPSRVRELQQSPLDYGLLVELNTRPRTRYLAAVKNINPALPDGPS